MGLLDETVLLSSDKEPELRKQFPKLYGALGGLLGTSPDQFEKFGSVLDAAASARNSDVQSGASLGFIPGLSLNFTPAIGAALATKGSGFGKVGSMLEEMYKSIQATGEVKKLPKVPTAVLSDDEIAGFNANRPSFAPMLKNPVLDWRGNHHVKSRGPHIDGNNYPIEELQSQLDSVTSQKLIPVIDRHGRVAMEIEQPRTNYLGQSVNDQLIINVDQNGRGEIFSIIPDGDGLRKGQKTSVAPLKPGYLSKK